MIPLLKLSLALFALLYVLPLSVAAIRYLTDGTAGNWRTADRSSIGVLPPPAGHSPALKLPGLGRVSAL